MVDLWQCIEIVGYFYLLVNKFIVCHLHLPWGSCSLSVHAFFSFICTIDLHSASTKLLFVDFHLLVNEFVVSSSPLYLE
jgi:hypothetical protein